MKNRAQGFDLFVYFPRDFPQERFDRWLRTPPDSHFAAAIHTIFAVINFDLIQ
jgi:hypothetical protein